MYLSAANSWAITRKLYVYKLHALIGTFTSLVFVQLLALALSLGGSSHSSYGLGDFSVTVDSYSTINIFGFTLIWVFFTAITVHYKSYRDAEYSFVTNRLTSHLSNVAFLLTASAVGGLTVPLLGTLLKLIIYWTTPDTELVMSHFTQSPIELLVGMFVTALAASLLSSLGYVVGTLVQMNKLWILILSGLFLTLLSREHKNGILTSMVKFYSGETSLAFFSLKIVITAVILYTFAILISYRMEVRR